MPLYIAQSGNLDRCYRCLTQWLTDWLTDWQTLKDKATQLPLKYKSGALVTQLAYLFVDHLQRETECSNALLAPFHLRPKSEPDVIWSLLVLGKLKNLFPRRKAAQLGKIVKNKTKLASAAMIPRGKEKGSAIGKNRPTNHQNLPS